MQWVPINGLELYEISSEGDIRNVRTGRILRQSQHPRTGLMMVSLSNGMTNRTYNVHRLVASHFIGPGEQGFAPHHLNGDKTDNRADNLEWKTLSHIREITTDRALTSPTDSRAVVAIDLDRTEYDNALQAARALGGLEKYVLIAAGSYGTMTYLRTRWVFKVALEVNPPIF